MDRPLSSYWNHTGFHQRKLDILKTHFPDAGPVKLAGNRPEIERLRKALNCYVDLYTNKLQLKAQSFCSIFGFRSSDFLEDKDNRIYSDGFYRRVEDAMDSMIMQAWLEQQKREE